MAYDYADPKSYLEANRIELIEAASRGMGGSGALVEAMFRLSDTIQEQEKATKRLNTLLLWFTIVIAFFTVALFALTVVQVHHDLRQPTATPTVFDTHYD